jgi:hypothetical protein
MGLEFPDFLRGIALIGKSGATYLPVAVDPTGQLYIVLTGAPDVTIPGTVSVDDLNTLKQIQGTDGTVYRTAKVDASGQFIMVPRGQSGNYMAVDAAGYLTAILKGLKPDASLGSIAVDASGQLIMVPRGATGNYMNVDAAGYLTAILKGLEGANLRTIAVDATGRMIGLIADANAAWGYTQNLGLADLGAALGSVQRWDHRGQVFDAMTFDTGLPLDWEVQKHGNEVLQVVPGYGSHGAYSLSIIMENVAVTYAMFKKRFRTVPLSKFGIECSFSFPSTKFNIAMICLLYNGTNYQLAGLYWNTSINTLYYMNSSAGYTNLSTGAKLRADARVFNHMKLVADFSAAKYVRALWNEEAYSIPTQPLLTIADATERHMFFYILVDTSTPNAETCYIDDIIITNEEPA